MSQNLSIFEQAGKNIPEGLSDNKVKTVSELLERTRLLLAM